MFTTAQGQSDRLPRGPHNLSRAEVVEHQRERMLAAVIRAVAEKGYASATIGDITRAARVSRDTFYEQFEGKEECFLAAYDQVTGALLGEVIAVGTSQANYVDGVRDGIRAFLRFWSEHPEAARACTLELLAVGEAARTHRERIMSSMMRLFRSIAERAESEQPGLPALYDAVPRAIVVASVELITDYVREGRVSSLPDAEQDMVYLWLMGLAGHDVAAAAMER